MKIVVDPPEHINSVRIACGRLNISRVVSGMRIMDKAEPLAELTETHRAVLASVQSMRNKESRALVIGIKNGFLSFGKDSPITLEVAVIVVLTKDGREITATSSGIRLPKECVNTSDSTLPLIDALVTALRQV